MNHRRFLYFGLILLVSYLGWRSQTVSGDPTLGFVTGLLIAVAMILVSKILPSVLGRRRFKRLYQGLVAADTKPEEKAALVQELASMMAGREGILACMKQHGIVDAKAALLEIHRAVVAGGADIVIGESYVALSAMCDPIVLGQVLAAEDKAQAAITAVQRQYDSITLRGQKINMKDKA